MKFLKVIHIFADLFRMKMNASPEKGRRRGKRGGDQFKSNSPMFMHVWVCQNCIYLEGIWVVFGNFGLKTGINVNHQFWPESLTRYGYLRSWKQVLPNYIWVRIWLIPTSPSPPPYPTTMCTMGFHLVVMLLTRRILGP